MIAGMSLVRLGLATFMDGLQAMNPREWALGETDQAVYSISPSGHKAAELVVGQFFRTAGKAELTSGLPNWHE
jgi:hypothetical protein